MSFKSISESSTLQTSIRYQAAKKEMLETILEASRKIRVIQPSADGEVKEQYLKTIQTFAKNRGRDLYFPFLSSGLGSGPFIELVDGSVKLDMITGIGINFFGHTHPELVKAVIDTLASDVMQGNLMPSIQMSELLALILSKVGEGCRLKHGWLMCSGTMVNEVALKIVRQKKAPATKILAFKDCFAGRSTAMQEITDNPSYRVGQPIYGEVHYLPFYDVQQGLLPSIEATIRNMREVLARFPGKFAALMIELVQGEGGFLYAPREFYVPIFDEAKKAGLAIWIDEIQTFGRTGELFAYQKFCLNEYVDIVTIGKMLQACMVLYTEEYNPKPGLVAGTFSGSTAALQTAKRVVELLYEENLLGKEGKIGKLSRYFAKKLENLADGSCKGLISEIRAIGGMLAFKPFLGTLEDVKAVLLSLFDFGVVAFYCGHGPYLIRFLAPLGVMVESEVDQVCTLTESAVLTVLKRRNG